MQTSDAAPVPKMRTNLRLSGIPLLNSLDITPFGVTTLVAFFVGKEVLDLVRIWMIGSHGHHTNNVTNFSSGGEVAVHLDELASFVYSKADTIRKRVLFQIWVTWCPNWRAVLFEKAAFASEAESFIGSAHYIIENLRYFSRTGWSLIALFFSVPVSFCRLAIDLIIIIIISSAWIQGFSPSSPTLLQAEQGKNPSTCSIMKACLS